MKKQGEHARIPKFSYLVVHTIWPKILYHYTTYDCIERIMAFGLFPGGAVSSKPYVFLTNTLPWQASGSRDEDLMRTRPICIALDVELMVFQGYRLLESESGHWLTEDWAANHTFLYVYDISLDQFIWCNRAYPMLRKVARNPKLAQDSGFERSDGRNHRALEARG